MATTKRYKLNFTLADGSTKTVECDIPVSECITSLILDDGNKTLLGNIELDDHFTVDYGDKSANADNKVKLNPIPADYVNCTGWRSRATEQQTAIPNVPISYGPKEAFVYINIPDLYARLDSVSLKPEKLNDTYKATNIENLGSNNYRITFILPDRKSTQGIIYYYNGHTQTDSALEFLYRNGIYRHFITLSNSDKTRVCYFKLYNEDSKQYTSLDKIFSKIEYTPGVMYIYSSSGSTLSKVECVSAYEITTYSTGGSTTTRYIRSSEHSEIVTNTWTYKDTASLIHNVEADLLTN